MNRNVGIEEFGPSDACAFVPKLADINVTSVGPFDLFVLAAGFEERAVATLRELGGKFRADTVIVGQYATNSEDNERNLADIYTIATAHGAEVKNVRVEEAYAFRETLLDEVARYPGKCRIGVDISGASGEFILTIFAAIFELQSKVSCTVFYARAATYFPKREDWASAPFSMVERLANEVSFEDSVKEFGVDGVSTHQCFPGIHRKDVATAIIAVPSIRLPRLARCLSTISEHALSTAHRNVFWMLTQDASPADSWRYDLLRSVLETLPREYSGTTQSGGEEIFTEDNHLVIDPADFPGSIAKFVTAVDQFVGRNIVLVHMGAKLHAVAIAAVLVARSEVRAVGARPSKYNPSAYSVGYETPRALHIDDVAKFVERLRNVGAIKLHSNRRGFGHQQTGQSS